MTTYDRADFVTIAILGIFRRAAISWHDEAHYGFADMRDEIRDVLRDEFSDIENAVHDDLSPRDE
jgi:hypothetical protein